MIKCTLGSIITRDYFMEEWVRNLKKMKFPKKDMRLVWVVTKSIEDKILPYFNSFKKGFQEAEMVLSPFKVYDHVVEAQSKEGFQRKRWGVSLNFNILYQYRKGDLFIIEDDVFPPFYAYTKLSSLARFNLVGAASGISYNWKFGKEDTPLAWFFIKRRVLPWEVIEEIKKKVAAFDFFDYDLRVLNPGGVGVEEVHASSTGCVYVNERCLKDYYATPEGDLRVGQDINLGWHITHELMLRYLLDHGVLCGHKHVDECGNVKGV